MHEGQGRAFLTVNVVGAALLMVAACTPAAPPAAKPTTAPAAAAPTTAPPVAAQPTTAPPGKPEPPKPDAAQVQQGQMLVAQKGCGGCHTIPGVAGATGAVGPNLAGVATRSAIAGGALQNTGPDDLKRWILDPPAAKPGTQMPKLGLTDAEATSIVAFLETLR